MKRILFAVALVLILAPLGLVGYAVVTKVLTDSLLHYLAACIGAGLMLAALLTDPTGLLALVDRAIGAWRGKGTPQP